MADSSKMMEWAWKGITLLIGIVLVPTFGWVWTMQIEVTTLKNNEVYATQKMEDLKVEVKGLNDDFEDLEDKVSGFSTTSTDVNWLKTSLDTLNTKLDRIETRLVNF